MAAKRILIKTLSLFLVLELLVAVLPLAARAVDVYHPFGIARERFPLSTVAPIDAALDVGNLDAMFASHVIARAKAPGEFRVVVLGDSTIWGMQLEAKEVLPARLGDLGLACGHRRMRFYNLSFPRSSATKDILILDRALETEPDAIVWLVTLYTLMPKTRVDHWLVEQNPEAFGRLGWRFDFLPRGYAAPGPWQRFFDLNRGLYRTSRYELYSLVQLATGRDQIPGPPQIPATELRPEETFEGLRPPTLRKNQLSLDQVADMLDLAADLPVLIVNEPILIMQAVPNSDVRYNSYYPRWAYDQYRQFLVAQATLVGWNYLDLWNLFPPEDFADTPLHLTPSAHRLLAERLAPEIEGLCQ